MDVNTALHYCRHMSSVRPKLEILRDLGLGYLALGEETTSLSGGEDGGRIVACGSQDDIRSCKESVTGKFIL